jgi:hypothetical protein
LVPVAYERGLETVIAIYVLKAEPAGIAHPMLIDVVVNSWPQPLNLVLVGIHPYVAAIATVGADALGRL